METKDDKVPAREYYGITADALLPRPHNIERKKNKTKNLQEKRF